MEFVPSNKTSHAAIKESNHSSNKRPHLIRFLFKHRNFWIPELSSLLHLNGYTSEQHSPNFFDDKYNHDIRSPFLPVTFPNDQVAKEVCSKAMLINRVYEVWASASSYSELIKDVDALPESFTNEYYDEKQTFSLEVDSFGKNLTRREKNERRDQLNSAVKFRGSVNIKSPEHTFWIIEDWGDLAMLSYKERHPLPSSTTSFATNTRRTPKFRRVYFLREICQGDGSRVASAYSLKERQYLGPTTMDVQLSFVMGHQGLVRPGSVVMDPFVGTGSLLVACAALGASLCIGTDIDVRVLKGMNRIARSTKSDIFTNFKQYNLPPPCILRADNSERGNVFCHHHHYSNINSSRSSSNSSSDSTSQLQLRKPFLDAIVCDPPYGVRAGAKRCGTNKMNKNHTATINQYEEGHMTMTQKYETEDVMLDLLNMAASMLVMGGRLVYLLPCLVSFNSEDELPIHPCLKLIANSEQVLSRYWSRRLITMEKCMEYDPMQSEEYLRIAKNQIRKGQEKHQQATVAYTDLQNKIKMLSRENKKLNYQEVDAANGSGSNSSGGSGSGGGSSSSSTSGSTSSGSTSTSTSSTSTSTSSRISRKRKSGTGDGSVGTFLKRSRKLFVVPYEIYVEKSRGRAHPWSYYGYDWRKSLKMNSDPSIFRPSPQAWSNMNELLRECDIIFSSGSIQFVFDNDHQKKMVKIHAHRGSIWGAKAKQAYDALINNSSSSNSILNSASFVPKDLIVSKKTISEHLKDRLSRNGSNSSTNSSSNNNCGFGVQVSIKFSPFESRDEAGLYLWLDPLNYIKIIVQGARRQASKPEITVATQQNGLPTSSPTYWCATGLTDVENKEFIVRLEVNSAGTKCAGMVWCTLTNEWHIVGVLSLNCGSISNGGNGEGDFFQSKNNIRSLRPMICTFTPKIHKLEDHNNVPLSAEFSRFDVFPIPLTDSEKQEEAKEVSYESKVLKMK